MKSIAEIRANATPTKLRVFAVGLALIATGIGVMRSSDRWSVAISAVCAVTLLVTTIRPATSKPLYMAWMTVLWPIGWLVSTILLAMSFYGVVTPIGLLMRLRRDPLNQEIDSANDSYWQPTESSDSSDQYFHQF